MRKLLRPKDLLLLGLAGFLDVFEVARDPFGIAADSCKNLYGWVPDRFKRHNFWRMVVRSLKTGEIEKVVKSGEPYLRLTTSGEERITRDFPMFSLQKNKWDRKWRVVVFDIAEVSRQIRDLLRLKFKELGFGMLQESVWITPHDMALDFREFLKAKGLGDYVYVMEVSHLLAGDPRSLAKRVWHLERLNEDYENILQGIKRLKQMYIRHNDRVKRCQAKITIEKEKLAKDEKEKLAKERFERRVEMIKRDLREQYLGVLMTDPCLPKELLPNNWVADLVKKEIYKL